MNQHRREDFVAGGHQGYEMVPTSPPSSNSAKVVMPYDVESHHRSVYSPAGDGDANKDPYDLSSLDRQWFRIVKDKLRDGQFSSRYTAASEDLTDSSKILLRGDFEAQSAAASSAVPVSPRRSLFTGYRLQEQQLASIDEIDSRGTFDARELERDLLEFAPGQLEDTLGLPRHKVREIIRRADLKKNGVVEYKAFLETVRSYRLTTEQEGKLKAAVRTVAFAEEFTCHPPKLFILTVTLVEACFFVYHAVHLKAKHGLAVTWEGPVPLCSVLIYNPYRRWEAWRFVTYMLVHIGLSHFVFNMIFQVLVGIPLEMEQDGWVGSLKVAAVYFAGVLAGSLGTSLSDPATYIAGASGGAYALIAAHLATLALNWHEDNAVRIRKVIQKPITKIVRLVIIVTLVAHDVAFAVYYRYYSETEDKTGYMGHVCGALAGLLVGIFVLDNRRVQRWEPAVQWTSLALFCLMIGFAVIWNIFGDQWVGGRHFPPPDYRLYNDASGNCKHYDSYY